MGGKQWVGRGWDAALEEERAEGLQAASVPEVAAPDSRARLSPGAGADLTRSLPAHPAPSQAQLRGHSSVKGIVFPACRRQTSANKIPPRQEL